MKKIINSRKYDTQAEEFVTENNRTFFIRHGTLEKYVGPGGNVVIPEGITEIGWRAFDGCTGLTSVNIPDGVTTIGRGAFDGCRGLTSVTIPEGVTEIGWGAFDNCTGLAEILVDTKNPIYRSNNGMLVKKNSLILCPLGKTGDVTIAGGVTEIGPRAFRNCTGLTGITIPVGVAEVGKNAFSGCFRLTSVTLPESITKIEDGAFDGCIRLTEILVDSKNPVYRSNNGMLVERNSLTVCPLGRTGDVTIAEGITTIGYDAFRGCRGLTSVTILEGVTGIGEDAFSGCTGLVSVILPEGITTIKNRAFKGCTSLTDIFLPESVTEIGYDAFRDCTGLTGIALPENVTEIRCNAFRDCTGLASVSIPEGVTEIWGGAFSGCKSLTSVTIPEGITYIGDGAFWDCWGLISMTIPEGVTEIGDYAFSGCTGLTNVTLPESITKIGDYAFSGCTGLTEILVNTKNPVYRSNNGMLVEKNSLILCPLGKTGDVTIAEGVTTIRNGAFKGCTGLTSVYIPASVTRIWNKAFEGCSGLTDFAVAADSKYYTSIDGILTNKKRTILCICPTAKNGTLTIPAGIKKIRDNACSGCSKLTGIVIPNSVTEIGSSAFSGCSSLTSLTLPDGVKEISNSVLSGCSALIELTLPRDAHSIGCRAFGGCRSLKTLKIPDGVTQIDEHVYPFYGCSSLKNVTFPAQMERLPHDLSFNSAIEDITLLGAATKVHKNAFTNGSKSDVNVHIFAPNMELTNLPTELRIQAVKGFAIHYCAGEALPEAYRANYLKYIRRQRKRLVPLAVKCESVLRIMITEKLLSNQEIPLLLDECDKQHNITARAEILEYQHQNLKPVGSARNEKKS